MSYATQGAWFRCVRALGALAIVAITIACASSPLVDYNLTAPHVVPTYLPRMINGVPVADAEHRYADDSPQCVEARLLAESTPMPDSVFGPLLARFQILPGLVNRNGDLASFVFTMRISSSGQLLPGTLTIEQTAGATQPKSFNQRLAQLVNGYTWKPAIFRGCSVAGVAVFRTRMR